MAQSPFVPDKPIGDAHVPDSPDLPQEAECEVCYHKGKKYDEGAKIYLKGFVHECRGGVWRHAPLKCE